MLLFTYPLHGQVTIQGEPGSYATIQAALDAAAPGATILVPAGSYTTPLSISKSVHLRGPNAGIAGTASRNAEAVISDASTTVTGEVTVSIDGFHMLQTNANSANVGLSGSASVTVANNILERNADTPGNPTRAIEISSGTGEKTIHGNLFKGSTAGGYFSGHRSWNSAIYANCSNSKITIENNTFQDCRTALNLDDFNADVLIQNNEFKTNGTHISFGGVQPTDGQFTLGSNSFVIPPPGSGFTFINLSNVKSTFRLDVTSSSDTGVPFSTLSQAALFNVEGAIRHRLPGPAGMGLVTYKAGHLFVVKDRTTIQSAIDYAGPGDIINLQNTTYNEQPVIGKAVTLAGAGIDNTILKPATSCTGTGIIINSDGVNVRDLNVENFRYGIVIAAGGTTQQIRNIKGIGNCVAGIAVPYNGQVPGFSPEQAAITGLVVDNVDITGSLEGIEVFVKPDGTGTPVFDNVRITNSKFSGNTNKGIYLERAKNLLIDNVEIDNSGTDPANNSNNNGIDLNLKFAAYSGITIRNSRITNSGVQGSGGTAADGPAAIAVKARDDGSYASKPASLTDVLLENNVISGPENGIRIGEYGKVNLGPSNVVIKKNDLSSAFANKAIVNNTNASPSLECNWFGTTSLPGILSKLSASGSGTNNLVSYAADAGFASCTGPVRNLTQGTHYFTIQAAVDAANANDIIEISDGTYPESVSVPLSLTLQGTSKTGTILDGSTLTGTRSGVTVEQHVTNVTIKNLTVQGYTGANGNSNAGIYAKLGNNNLLVTEVVVRNNPNASGFYAGGPVDNVTVTKSTFENHGPGARGIVIWNGLKKNITFTDNIVSGNNCCGIELQDGTASGVYVAGNTIAGMDNAIGVVGLTDAPGALRGNVIENNNITVNGRYGIEIKNPDGTGNDNDTENGAIIVRGNTVTFGSTTRTEDLAGIAVFRRSVLAGNVDVPTGVVIKNNTVQGFRQSSSSDGFGILIEGTNHTVTGNILDNNDVGIQQQAGNGGYPGNSNDVDLPDTYFGRGNSPMTCGNVVASNTFNSNGLDTRNIATGGGLVTNTSTGEAFCSIQAAIDDAQTLDGHTLNAGPGTYRENLVIHKSITLEGTSAAATVLANPTASPKSGYGIQLQKGGVALKNFKITDYSAALRVHNNFAIDGLTIDNLAFEANRFGMYIYNDTPGASKVFDNVTIQNSVFDGNTDKALYIERANNLTIRANEIRNSGNGTTPQTGAGIDINLKYASFNGITFAGNTVDNTGNTAYGQPESPAALSIKARQDGSYSTQPATLGNVRIQENTILNTHNAIRIGETGTTNDGTSGVIVEKNNFSYNYNNRVLVNNSPAGIHLECNWFGTSDVAVITPRLQANSTGENILVNYAADNTFGSCIGPVKNREMNTYFLSIQAAIDDPATAAGHHIDISNGTYSENVSVTKSVKLVGASKAGVIIQGSGINGPGNGITVSADNVKITRLTVTNHNLGITVADNADNSNLVVNEVAATGNRIGLIALALPPGSPGSRMAGTQFDNARISSSDFSDNAHKGIYLERASNLVIDTVTVANSGNGDFQAESGAIDINLKYGTYSNITVSNSTITNSANKVVASYAAPGTPIPNAGGALMIKARNDGSYAASPATLSNVLLAGNTITGAYIGISSGEPGQTGTGAQGLVIRNNNLENAASHKAIVNHTNTKTALLCNWFGSTDFDAVRTNELLALGTGPNVLASLAQDAAFSNCLAAPCDITVTDANSVPVTSGADIPSGTLHFSTGAGYDSYQWYGCSSASAGSCTFTDSFSPAGNVPVTQRTFSQIGNRGVKLVRTIGGVSEECFFFFKVVPYITEQSQTACTATLRKNGSNGTNQWYKDNNPISGATSDTYTATESGNYKLVVTVSGNTFESAIYPVTLSTTPPVFSFSANGAPLANGATATFCEGDPVLLELSGTAGDAYTLLHGSNVVGTGTLDASYPFTAATSDAGNYTLTVSGGGCDVTHTYQMVVNALPNLVIHNPATVVHPATVDLTAPAVTQGSDPGLTLAYFKDAAATVPLSAPDQVTPTGVYYIQATAASGCTTIKPVNVDITGSLPVKLADFEARRNEGHILLTWTTTEEINFDRFEVQRSVNPAAGFRSLGFVVSNPTGRYQFPDASVFTEGVVYYRLKMIDRDGSVEFSKIISIRSRNNDQVRVYPNPASDYIQVVSTDAIASVELISNTGKVVKLNKYSPKNTVAHLTLEHIPAGIYHLRIIDNLGIQTYKRIAISR